MRLIRIAVLEVGLNCTLSRQQSIAAHICIGRCVPPQLREWVWGGCRPIVVLPTFKAHAVIDSDTIGSLYERCYSIVVSLP